jgi:hypothetical protein
MADVLLCRRFNPMTYSYEEPGRPSIPAEGIRFPMDGAEFFALLQRRDRAMTAGVPPPPPLSESEESQT